MPKTKRTEDQESLVRFIGLQIARARMRAGLTQAELAGKFGRDQTWIQRIEAGRNSILAYDLVRIAELTDTPVGWFTDPNYQASLARPPSNRLEWESLYGADPALAAAHWQIDQLGKADGSTIETPPPPKAGRPHHRI